MSDNCCIEESLARYVGQTVTIFTTSGGLSGSPYCIGVFLESAKALKIMRLRATFCKFFEKT